MAATKTSSMILENTLRRWGLKGLLAGSEVAVRAGACLSGSASTFVGVISCSGSIWRRPIFKACDNSRSVGVRSPRMTRPRKAARFVGSILRADSRQYFRSRGESTTELIHTQYSAFCESARRSLDRISRALARSPTRTAAIASVSIFPESTAIESPLISEV
jgi:hypothetical protein